MGTKLTSIERLNSSLQRIQATSINLIDAIKYNVSKSRKYYIQTKEENDNKQSSP